MEHVMIKPISADSDRRRAARAAFTLVEMLVVMGIIILLVGLLMPMVTRAYRNAERAKVGLDLQSISSALEAYNQDFKMYPQPGITPGGYGSDQLGAALCVSFQTVANGKTWGAYLPSDRFKLSGTRILDRFRKPILYYNRKGSWGVTTANSYVAAQNLAASPVVKPRYDVNQNSDLITAANVVLLRALVGDVAAAPTTISATTALAGNGMIDGVESTIVNLPYLLISCGPDELYGPQKGDAPPVTTLTVADLQKCDDITNFDR